MGFYYLILGNGVMVDKRYFFHKYRKQIDKYDPNHKKDGEEVVEYIVKTYIGEEFSACEVGHDAFGDHTYSTPGYKKTWAPFTMGVFDGWDDRPDVFTQLKEWDEEYKDTNKDQDHDLPHKYYFGLGNVIFIGCYKELTEGGEFSWGTKKRELVYGLAAFLPQLVKEYRKLEKIDCSVLKKKFKQKPFIWTFAPDCCCCT